MKITRISGLIALTAAAAVVLTACGSDNNTTGSSAAAGASSAASSAVGGASSVAGSAAGSGASSAAGSSDSASSAMLSGATGAAATTFAGAGFTCATGDLRSSGSTAQGKVISAWIVAYNAKCGSKINDYGGGGSGKGVSDFTANQSDFGGSDSALKAAEMAAVKTTRCQGNDAIDLPMVTGPIAVAYNVKGVDKLVLTPKVLVDIFGGKVTSWNDPEIADLNKGVTLPGTKISPIHRSEDSGTTDNFTKYLTAAGGWTYPGGKAWTAPGGQGIQGSDGVQKAIGATDGAIGYAEWGYAVSGKLAMAEIDNGGGPVALTAETAAKSVATAQVVGTGKDLSLKLDYATKTAGAYPILLVTYEIVCSAGNGDKAALLKSFLGYAATDGQTTAVSNGAAPLPAAIQTKVIDAIKGLS
ncbi:MAG: phosphate ABC transporter substrate-binding protein PstS [Actinomycetota bacterium]|nr:phosphate ABC transporter substrate-binding protein PstS [Actinomycetota bacterium]